MIYLLIILITFLSMEAVAWLAHKYIMHGAMWTLHEDHHQKNPLSFFEKNDYFFLIFAIPAIIFFVLGSLFPTLFFVIFIAIGITLYGIAYFFVHDVFIHQRFKWFSHSENFYFRAIRKAHKMHHKHLYKEDGECFGMIFVPLKYLKEALNNKSNKK